MPETQACFAQDGIEPVGNAPDVFAAKATKSTVG
jgi:hypothetical protein